MAEFKVGNIFVRDNQSPHEVGDVTDGGCHNFDHARFILAGSYHCRVWSKIVDATGAQIGEQWHLDIDREFTAPHFCNIEANKKHDFRCTEGPGILWCAYSMRRPGAKNVLVVDGWETGDEDTTVSVTGPDGVPHTRKMVQNDPRLIALLGGQLDDASVVQHWMGNKHAVS